MNKQLFPLLMFHCLLVLACEAPTSTNTALEEETTTIQNAAIDFDTPAIKGRVTGRGIGIIDTFKSLANDQ